MRLVPDEITDKPPALPECTPSGLNANDCHPAPPTTNTSRSPAVGEINAAQQGALNLPDLKIVQPVKLGETDHVQINVDGEMRDVYLHVPLGYDEKNPIPLAIVFNGLNTTGGPQGMDKITDLGQKADQYGFAVAFLAGGGMKGGYNNGQLPFDHQDDVKYTDKVIDALQTDLNIDKDRTYLVGISWGGSMMHKAMSQLSYKIAAGIDVAGFMTGKEKWESPTDHVSELSIHSKDDQTIYYDGRTSLGHAIFGFHQEPVQATFDFYRKQDGMEGEPTVTTTKAPDGTTVTTRTSLNPNDGTEVQLMTLEGAKHGWPGSFELPGTLNATDIIVDFMLRHTRGH